MTSYTSRANHEFADAIHYYAGRAGAATAARFDQAVETAERRIAADPTSLPLVLPHGSLRTCRVERFPYDLIFRVEPSEVVNQHVWHHHRDPANLSP